MRAEAKVRCLGKMHKIVVKNGRFVMCHHDKGSMEEQAVMEILGAGKSRCLELKKIWLSITDMNDTEVFKQLPKALHESYKQYRCLPAIPRRVVVNKLRKEGKGYCGNGTAEYSAAMQVICPNRSILRDIPSYWYGNGSVDDPKFIEWASRTVGVNQAKNYVIDTVKQALEKRGYQNLTTDLLSKEETDLAVNLSSTRSNNLGYWGEAKLIGSHATIRCGYEYGETLKVTVKAKSTGEDVFWTNVSDNIAVEMICDTFELANISSRLYHRKVAADRREADTLTESESYKAAIDYCRKIGIKLVSDGTAQYVTHLTLRTKTASGVTRIARILKQLEILDPAGIKVISKTY